MATYGHSHPEEGVIHGKDAVRDPVDPGLPPWVEVARNDQHGCDPRVDLEFDPVGPEGPYAHYAGIVASRDRKALHVAAHHKCRRGEYAYRGRCQRIEKRARIVERAD
ncbi:MAG TPA: hypothetical protein PKH25_05765, partial [Syntrophales bacterium]|nr:hypothetical protein [Syntrophales bacterium]